VAPVDERSSGASKPSGKEEPSGEPSKNDLAIVSAWGVWEEVTGKTRYQLTTTRKRRLKKVLAAIKRAAPDKDTVPVWRVLVTCLWSDPWRREDRNRHDPTTVYKSDEQVEGWVLYALDEIEHGRDGSDFHLRQNGAVEREAAEAEEKDLQRKRVERKRESTERMERLDAAQSLALESHHARLKEWYTEQTPTEKARIKRRVETELRMHSNGSAPSEGAKLMVWTSVLTTESEIRLGGETT